MQIWMKTEMKTIHFIFERHKTDLFCVEIRFYANIIIFSGPFFMLHTFVFLCIYYNSNEEKKNNGDVILLFH